MPGRTDGDKGAFTVRVGEKGQIVIPKEARDMFGIQPGDTLLLLAERERGIAIPPKSEFEKLTGFFFAASFGGGPETEEEET